MEKASGLLNKLLLILCFFPAGYSMGAPWAQAQLKNRMEGSGRRQLTGEPTFLTQVPKESDANTPSALSIAFINSLLRVPSPFGEGALLGQWALHVLYLGTFWGWSKGTIPGGSSHSPAFANAHKKPGDSYYSQQQVYVFLLFPLCLTLSSWVLSWGLKCIFSPLALHQPCLGNDKEINSCFDFCLFVGCLRLEKYH